MAVHLTKSYINTHDSDHPVQEDLVLYQLFEKARKEGFNGELVNLETNKRMTSNQILDKADQYAKGLLAVGLIPGQDILTVIGCPTLEAGCLFTAACSIGIAYAHPYIYTPRETSINNILPILRSRVVIAGEGAGGETLSALLNLFEDVDFPSSSILPSVEHLFYDDTYKNRSPTQKNIKTLDRLRELGESVTDKQLEEAKRSVKPEFTLFFVFTSGSTGKPKCVAHTHRGLANDLLQLRADNLPPLLALNFNIDEIVSYSCFSWTMAGKMTKTVFITDIIEEPEERMAKAICQGIVNEKVEIVGLPPTFEQFIAAYAKANNIKLPSQQFFVSGAALISRQFKENLQAVFNGKPLTLYGMSENWMLGWVALGDRPEDQEARMEARIHPKPNSEFRLVDENNEVVDIGKDGEIQVKTYSLLKEYLGQEEKTRAAYTEDGFFRTGDMAVMGPDGSFVIKGRVAEAMRFKIFGDVIYPGPIEEVVTRYPGVKDALVIAGSYNDWLGDEITYCIRLKEGVTEPSEESLLEFCADHGLQELTKPARVMYFEDFPTTANARKVSKALLRDKVKKMIEDDPHCGECDWFIKFKLAFDE